MSSDSPNSLLSRVVWGWLLACQESAAKLQAATTKIERLEAELAAAAKARLPRAVC